MLKLKIGMKMKIKDSFIYDSIFVYILYNKTWLTVRVDKIGFEIFFS